MDRTARPPAHPLAFGHPVWQPWTQFEALFIAAFGDSDVERVAYTKMQSLHQGYRFAAIYAAEINSLYVILSGMISTDFFKTQKNKIWLLILGARAFACAANKNGTFAIMLHL
jgi:hypothetical protein